jgi:hypothetical protein
MQPAVRTKRAAPPDGNADVNAGAGVEPRKCVCAAADVDAEFNPGAALQLFSIVSAREMASVSIYGTLKYGVPEAERVLAMHRLLTARLIETPDGRRISALERAMATLDAPPMPYLPPEIMLHVLSYVRGSRDRRAFSAVCKDMCALQRSTISSLQVHISRYKTPPELPSVDAAWRLMPALKHLYVHPGHNCKGDETRSADYALELFRCVTTREQRLGCRVTFVYRVPVATELLAVLAREVDRIGVSSLDMMAAVMRAAGHGRCADFALTGDFVQFDVREHRATVSRWFEVWNVIGPLEWGRKVPATAVAPRGARFTADQIEHWTDAPPRNAYPRRRLMVSEPVAQKLRGLVPIANTLSWRCVIDVHVDNTITPLMCAEDALRHDFVGSRWVHDK